MKQQTVNNLNDFAVMIADSEVVNHDIGFIISELHRITSKEKVGFIYNRTFTHPQILPNEMLYIGHFLEVPFCLDLGCPGAVHILTGNRTGLVDEWDWFGNFGEALKAAEQCSVQKTGLEVPDNIHYGWPE